MRFGPAGTQDGQHGIRPWGRREVSPLTPRMRCTGTDLRWPA